MKKNCEGDNAEELDFYLRWHWPETIETALRRLLWVSLLEAGKADSRDSCQKHYARFRTLIAAFPESPPAVLHFLVSFEEPRLLVYIAENENSNAETLAYLARSEYAEVRTAVAENKKTSFDILTALARDESLDVRYSMAENANLPGIILEQLAEDDNVYVSARAFRTLSRRVSKTSKYQTSQSPRKLHPHSTLKNVVRIHNRPR